MWLDWFDSLENQQTRPEPGQMRLFTFSELGQPLLHGSASSVPFLASGIVISAPTVFLYVKTLL